MIAAAKASLNSMATYQVKINRQERVNGTLLPAEDLMMKIRREPLATRLIWTDGPHRGREVIYRADEPGGLMHVNMADSKLPVPRLNLDPKSPMVLKNSRHPITEAGLEPIVAGLAEANQAGILQNGGLQASPWLNRPHQVLVRTTPEGDVWRVSIDPTNYLPRLVECVAANGDLLERYQFEDMQPNPTELASNAAFDPDTCWGAPRGLFGRKTAKQDANGTETSTR